MVDKLKLRNITIIGLGLIGGSLAAACRRAFPRARIVGISRSRKALAKAKKRKWIHEGTSNLGRGLRSAEFVVLCTPVDTLKEFLKRIDRLAPAGVVVTDTGSVKGFLVRWADRQRWRHLHFVGAHPMAGSHEQGIDPATPHLFDHALTFVTPGRRSFPKAFRQVRDFWRNISHRVAVVSPEKHDRITSEVSHLPHLVAALLVASASSKSLCFAASGFLDTTRVAQGDPRLWVPILFENRMELKRTLQCFEMKLDRVKGILTRGNLLKLRRSLLDSQKRRVRLDPSST